MLTSIFNVSIHSTSVEQAFTDIIKSIAAEEEALSNIFNLEREIIEKAKKDTHNLGEFISVNESINSILKNVAKLQMLTQIKLAQAEELFQKIGDSNESDEPRELSQRTEEFYENEELEE